MSGCSVMYLAVEITTAGLTFVSAAERRNDNVAWSQRGSSECSISRRRRDEDVNSWRSESDHSFDQSTF